VHVYSFQRASVASRQFLKVLLVAVIALRVARARLYSTCRGAAVCFVETLYCTVVCCDNEMLTIHSKKVILKALEDVLHLERKSGR